MTFVASFHDAFDRVSAFFALSSSGTCDAASALVELWCCLASVAAVSAYRPTRSLPATGRQRAGALVTLCEGGDAQEWPPPSVWLQQAGAMWVTAALLGLSWARSAVCDGRHSAHDRMCFTSASLRVRLDRGPAAAAPNGRAGRARNLLVGARRIRRCRGRTGRGAPGLGSVVGWRRAPAARLALGPPEHRLLRRVLRPLWRPGAGSGYPYPYPS